MNQEPAPEGQKEETQFDMYPNPATTVLHGEIEDHTIRQIGVYDVSGKLMEVFNFKSKQ